MTSIRTLRLFVAVCEEQSFTAAAKREHATQSGVSQHVRRLETALGVRLFIRRKTHVELTPAGESYYRSCIDVLRAFEFAGRSARQFKGGLDGQLIVGASPLFLEYMVGPAIKRFMEEHPNVSVHVIENYPDALTEKVSRGEIDFAIMSYVRKFGIRKRLLSRYPEVLISRWRDNSRQLEPVRLAELGPMNLLLPGKQSVRRHVIEDFCTTHGARIGKIMDFDGVRSHLQFVPETDWMTLVPNFATLEALESERHSFIVNPITPQLTIDAVIAEPLRQSPSPAAEILIEMLFDQANELHARWARIVNPGGLPDDPNDGGDSGEDVPERSPKSKSKSRQTA
jgi:LysR family transcriptional regulator, nitrogen assimilation regulatory protein